MKIGFIIYGSLDTLSGGYLYDRMLVEYLRAQGDTVEVISLPWRNYAAHLTDNLNFRLPKNLDILIQDELNHPSLVGANSRLHPCPVISLVHHLRNSEHRPPWQNALYRLVEKRYLNSVDGFIFNSKTTKKAVNELLINELPSVVAYPPTDRFDSHVNESDIADRASSNELRILFVGNVIQRKGLHTLLDAVALAARQDLHTRYHLDVVGSRVIDPRYVAFVDKRMQINDVSHLVQFHGLLNDESLAEKLRLAHLLCVPSYYEGYGIVYIEGMGFGLPAIGTRVGAAPEIIEDGRTGYLVEPGEPAPLAHCLLHLASNRELLTSLSVNALNHFNSKPSWQETAESIRDFLICMVDSDNGTSLRN